MPRLLAALSLALLGAFGGPARAEDKDPLAVLDRVALSAQQMNNVRRALSAGWGVVASPEKHYVVLYVRSRPHNRTLAANIEAIRQQFIEKDLATPRGPAHATLLRICADRKDYVANGGPPGSVGYWAGLVERAAEHVPELAQRVEAASRLLARAFTKEYEVGRFDSAYRIATLDETLHPGRITSQDRLLAAAQKRIEQLCAAGRPAAVAQVREELDRFDFEPVALTLFDQAVNQAIVWLGCSPVLN